MKTSVSILGILAFLILLGWVGLKIQPAPFPAFPQQSRAIGTVPVPDELPTAVKRFYDRIYGATIPVIESAVITGRAKIRLRPITFPGRFRFTYDAGSGYRHYIEITFFGLPIMKVNEHYLEGKSRLELPFGVVENEPKVDQAANLGLWAESIWLPAIYITDERVHWKPVDENTASLTVPFNASNQNLLVRFDPKTGLVEFVEAMRYKDAADTRRTLWINEVLSWHNLEGITTATNAAVTWFDEGTPWIVFQVEEVVYNPDVSKYIQQKGL